MNYNQGVNNFMIRGGWLLSKVGRGFWALYFLVLIVPIVFISIFGYRSTARALTDLEAARKSSLVALASSLIHEKLEDIKSLGISLAIRPLLVEKAEQGDWEAAAQVLHNVSGVFPFVDRIFLTDPQGVIRADLSSLGDAVGTDRRDTDWYKGVSKSWEPYICGVFKRRSLPRINVIDVAVPIKSISQKGGASQTAGEAPQVLGILVLQIRLDNFAQVIRDLRFREGEIFYIVDQKGHVVYHPYFPAQGDIVNLSSVPVVQEALKGQEGVRQNYNPIEKEWRLAAYQGVNDFGWGVIVTQPIKMAFSERDRILSQLRLLYGIFFFLGISFALLGWYLFSSQQRANQEMFDLYHHAPCGYSSIDKNGLIVRINDTALSWMGYSKGEVAGKMNLSQTMTPRSMQLLSEKFSDFLEEGRVQDQEFEVVRKDGTIFPVLVSATAVHDENGQHLMTHATWVDITGRKLAEGALRESEERFRALSESSMAGIYIVQDGVVKYVNPVLPRMLGYTKEDLMGVSPLKAVHQDDHALVMENMRKRVAGESSHSQYEIRLIRKDGSMLYFELIGARIIYDGRPALAGTLLDITERKHAEDALRHSREYLSKIINSVADPLFVKDREHRWVLFNDAFTAFMGRKGDEILWKSDYDFFPRQEADIFWMKDEEVFRSKKENVNEESFTDAGGTTRTIVTKKTLYVDNFGQTFIVGIIRDITDYKKAEEKLRRAALEWRRTFDSITDYVFLMDMEGRIIQVNKALAGFLGLRKHAQAA